MEKIKILLVTDSAALPSGLAETARLIFSSLLRLYPRYYAVHQVGLFHCYAVTVPEWPVQPTLAEKGPGTVRFASEDIYGQKTVPKMISQWKPDIVFAFGDPQRVLHLCVPPEKRSYKLLLYLNFDGLPAPRDFGPPLRQADLIVTKSEFSRQVLLDSLPDIQPEKLRYLYSPADIDRFKPVENKQKEAFRRELLPKWMPQNAFILGWVGRNQWRKQIWLLYKVLHYLRSGQYLTCGDCQRVTTLEWNPCRIASPNQNRIPSEHRPDFQFDSCSFCGSRQIEKAASLSDIFLWNHMPDEPGGDWPLRELERQFDVYPDRDLFYTEGYELKSSLAPDSVPVLYQLWDCLLYLSGGEGFGLPAWEAMCTGIPTVYTNYSSHAEFLGRANAGIPVSGILQPEAKECIWRMVADCGQAIEAVRRLYYDRDHAFVLGQNGRAFVQDYSVPIQVAKWHHVFRDLVN